MSSFSGVVSLLERGVDALSKLAALGVTPTEHAPARRLLVEVRTFRVDVLDGLAQRVVASTAAPAFVVLGQTGADVYLVAEHGPSGCVRRLEFNRDGEPQWTSSGTTRPWEAELHFAQPIDDLVETLTDWDWSEPDLQAFREAHAARDPSRLPRLPPLFRRSFVGFTEWLGVDLERPGGRWKPPGFFGRLVGRR